MNLFVKATGALATVLIAGWAVAAYKSTVTFQRGNPGLGMEMVNTHDQIESRLADNVIPPTLPPAGQAGQLAVDAYKNVQVLGHLPSSEFTRLMTAMTLWVAPDNGCGYCHAPERDAKGTILKDDNGNPLADGNNMHSDELYTKRVARRMLQMTLRLNGDWKEHVKTTGVTCYTCHRGNPVPKNIWFDEADTATRFQGIQNPPRNVPSAVIGSLPHGTFRPFFAGDENIRVQATEAMGSTDRSSIKQTEWTYGLMIHMSDALGVSCTYCHNSRSFGDWSASPFTRAQAWQGIRMVREINGAYVEPLGSLLPPERHGPLGDGPKANCATCHQGAYKPLLGVSMLADYQALAEAKPQPEKTPVPVATESLGDGGASDAAMTDGAVAASDGGTNEGGTKAVAVPLDAGAAVPLVAKPDAGTGAKPGAHP